MFSGCFDDHRDDVDMRRGGTAYLSQYLDEKSRIKAISSHHLCMPLPKNHEIVPLFLFRDPIERVRSVYLFERRQISETPGAIHAKKYDFKEYVSWRMRKDVNPTIRNFQTRYCSVDKKGISDITLCQTLDFLTKHALIGIVDRYDESMVCYEESLKRYFPNIDLAYVKQNVSSASEKKTLAVKKQEILCDLGETADILLKNNQLDITLYAEMQKLLDKRISAITDFDEKLKNFKSRCSQLV